MKKTVIIVLAIIVGVGALAYGGYRVWLYRLRAGWLARFERDLASPRRHEPRLVGPAIGPEKAPVKIVLFTDLRCVACRRWESNLLRFRRREPNKIRIFFRDFPLDHHCNPLLRGRPFHLHSCLAARYLHCAKTDRGYWKLRHMIVGYKGRFDSSILPRLARKAGISARKLKRCAESAEAQQRLSRDLREAKRLGIRSTPVSFFNGLKIRGAWSEKLLRRAVDKAARTPAGKR